MLYFPLIEQIAKTIDKMMVKIMTTIVKHGNGVISKYQKVYSLSNINNEYSIIEKKSYHQ